MLSPAVIARNLPTFSLLMAMLLWSSSFIALKIAFRDFDPMVVIFGRMLVASLCFLLVGKRIARSLDYRPGDYKPILFMAFCEPCLYFIFEAKAIENTSASQAGLLTAMLPILVMIAAALLLKEVNTKKSWIGAILAVVGVCWLTAESTPTTDAPNPVLGNFYEFLAMVCATGYTISLKQLTSRYSPFLLTAVQALIGSIFFFPLMFLPGTTLPTHFPLVGSLAVLYLGAVITLGAYGLYNFSLKHVPASRAAIFVNLIPVFSVALGWLVLGETLSATQCVAAVVVMSGVYLSQR
ncbi:DMT family transporter [Desulfopila aestuarii]|uniref:Permease of the drug/metabolite transporter (DMT) superfamily n=1 Tax=Desulfopila aestuarii DSM 18488 TaxID=1121416 RepID=A0A1M7Y3C4_9BACT|nr:DMT family transporter [Desulfopila aestuarii]SHO46331.1 Permease of the drug/metabolite transporter (DMT) superfamily [Desulfopila aestuarii DSM 18488]